MKNLKRLFFLCLTVLLIVMYSCSNDKAISDVKYMNFTGTIGSMTKVQATSWDAGDAIGVYMKNATGLINESGNVKYTTNGNGVFTPAGAGISLPDDGSKVGFVAYYPHKEILADNTYPINVAAQSPLSAIDLLYSDNVTASDQSQFTAALQFKHRLSLLVLNIKAGTGASLNKLAVSIGGLKTDGCFNLVNGHLTLGTTVADITPVVSVTGTTATIHAILVPEQNLQNAVITLTTVNSKWVLNHTKLPAAALESGKKYVYNITLMPQSAGTTVTADPITDWEAGATGGTAESGSLGETTSIPTLSQSSRPMLIVEQSQHKVIIVDSVSQGVMWEWRADDAREMTATQKKSFYLPDEAKAIYDNKYVLITGTRGGVAIIRISDKKTMFFAEPKGYPHSAEILPDGNVVVACSQESTSGNRLYLYKVDSANPYQPAPIAIYPLKSGHAVVWDRKNNCLWAAAYDTLNKYKYNAATSGLELIESIGLPTTDAHDLFPVYGEEALWLTTGRSIYKFDVTTHKFTVASFSRRSVKSVSSGPAGFGTLLMIPKPALDTSTSVYWSDEISNATGAPAFYRVGYKMYKARWFIPNTFSYPENDLFKQP